MSNKKKKVDLRIKRSRSSMQAALATLMEEKPYKNIKVSEITDQALVARPTFYLHFKTKDELLLSVIDEFFAEFFEDFDEYLVGFPDNFEGLLQFVLDELGEHAKEIQMIIQADKEHLLLGKFQEYISLAVERISNSEYFTIDKNALQYSGDILAGSLYLLSIRWLKEGMPYSPEAVGKLYYQVLENGVERLLSGEFNEIMRKKE
jgi:AcrR family transcriptional regulator